MPLFVLKAASSCLRYLMAVQNHLLSNTILIKPDENDDSDNSLQGETLKVQVNTKLYSNDAFYPARKAQLNWLYLCVLWCRISPCGLYFCERFYWATHFTDYVIAQWLPYLWHFHNVSFHVRLSVFSCLCSFLSFFKELWNMALTSDLICTWKFYLYI